MTHIIEVVIAFALFSSLLALMVGTFLEDNSACDELPMQHLRSTPEPWRVRLLTDEQDVTA